jgi:hypothetical protein
MDMINPNAARAWRHRGISIALVLGLSTAMLPVQAQAPQQSQEGRPDPNFRRCSVEIDRSRGHHFRISVRADFGGSPD